MTDGNDAPNVRIIPPLVYLAGIVIGFLASIGLPTKVVPNSGSVDGRRNSHLLRCCSDGLCPVEIQGCGHDSST
jgi:hypothetical protein